MAIYYVDASRPDDTGNGLSEGAAKKTIYAAGALLASGDTIKIKRGYCYDPTSGFFLPSFAAFNGGSLTITDYGSGDLPIWDGLTYEPASASDWTLVAASGGVWKKVFAATYVRRVFSESTSAGVLTTQRTIGSGLRRAPCGATPITSTTQNESEANIVAALQSFQFTAPWVPGGATTSYALYMWTGSETIQPPDYFNGLAFIQTSRALGVGVTNAIELQDLNGVLVENQHIRGTNSSAVRVIAENADVGDTNDITIQDCNLTHFYGYGAQVLRTTELSPTWMCTNGTIQRCVVNSYYGADEQELTLGEAVMSSFDGIRMACGADTWTIQDCAVTDSGHGGLGVDGSASGLSPVANITFLNNTVTFNASHSYARGMGSNNCSGIVFRGNTIINQNVRSQFSGGTVVDGNVWTTCRDSIRKPGTDQWIAIESYYYDNGSGLGDSVRYVPVWPTDVQVKNNRVDGTFPSQVLAFSSFDTSYGTPLWPANSVTFANNLVSSGEDEVLLLQRNGTTNAADIATPTFSNNVFYAVGAAGTNRVRWNATAAAPLTAYALSNAPGFAGTLETNPMTDTKISALPDGTAVQATDNIPAVRGAANVRVQIDLSDKVVGAASSVDNEIALFSGTGGKTIKRASTTGILKGTSGVISAATANTDYATPTVAKFLAEDTWENLPAAASYSGRIFPCTNVGNTGLTFWVSNGSSWRLMSPMDLFVVTDGAEGITSASEQVLSSLAALPAGVMTSLRYFGVKVLWSKDGTTDAAQLRVRVGSAGAASDVTDPAIYVSSVTGFAATNRTIASEHYAFAASATSVRTLAHHGDTGGWNGPTNSNTYPRNVTVPNMGSGATYITLTALMNGTTNKPRAPHVIVTGY